MPIAMEPREDGRILYISFSNPWTLTDLMQNMEKDQAYRDRAGRTIHAIVDCSQMDSLPPGTVNVGRRSPSFNHQTKGHLVAVGANGTIQAIGKLVARMLRMDNLKFFNTEEEGMAYLRQVIANEDATNQGQ